MMPVLMSMVFLPVVSPPFRLQQRCRLRSINVQPPYSRGNGERTEQDKQDRSAKNDAFHEDRLPLKC
jgi:hypothetical protein